MKVSIYVALCILSLSTSTWGSVVKNFFKNPPFKDMYGKLDANIKVGDAGDPLILTDLIKIGDIEGARTQAVVSGVFDGLESYAGYFRVDEVHDNNLFFWFFPSQSEHRETDPVILWLQGGPGSSSMFGLFTENGPLAFTDKGELAYRPTTWSGNNSVIYIDQPAGTGWSYTTKGGYAQNQTKVGEDLYAALTQFFTVFSAYQSNDFFVTGESYGGKYVPAISYAIHQNNPTADLKINLKGLAIGNGFTDPEHQLRYANYVYMHGLIDTKTRDRINEIENQAIDAIAQENWYHAFSLWNEDLNIIQTVTDIDIYNYLTELDDDQSEYFMGILFEKEDFRRAIHVGNTDFGDDSVYYELEEDIPKSQAPVVAELIAHYRVLIYSGQTDLIVPYPLTIDYLEHLSFSGSEDYLQADRIIWYDENNEAVVAGYLRTSGNLTDVVVRNSGHMVPTNQPEWALQMINKFVRNQPIAG